MLLALLLGSILQAALILYLLLRRQPAFGPLLQRLEGLERAGDRADRLLRDESAMGRKESAQLARQARQELAHTLGSVGDTLQDQLAASAELQAQQLALFSERLDRLTGAVEERLEVVRTTVDVRLRTIQEDSGAALERMRATVEEKLQGTLERRLGESFKQVSDRLEQVHRGLGEMQTLATGVGDLKRVLTNVKTRGSWGEVQLGALLEQVLAPDQFDKNVKTRRGSDELVEFAIRLPGASEAARGAVVYLPIDAKFPTEDYQRLVLAQEAADPAAAEQAGEKLIARIRGCAKDIAGKYLDPPHTTDFAVMFLPSEGLYAEVVRRVDAVETIQREHRVLIAGPSNLAALLNALQMGFRTLAVQQRSSEVWALLGQVKTEFGKFGETLDQVRKKLEQTTRSMDDVGVRSRAIEKRLREVTATPALAATPDPPRPLALFALDD